jgi:uncharacterized protein YxjI
MAGGAADQGARYLLREKLLSIGDDFWIKNDQGERIFYVDAKVLRVRDTVLIKDRSEMNWSSFRSGCCGPAIPWPSSAAATR